MFIELIDLLRCPVDHEESWLVAAFTKMDRRFVLEGKLGCPVCSRTYPIAGGAALFGGEPLVVAGGEGDISSDETIRTAALLGLTRPGSTIVMEGPEAATAVRLSEMTEARVIVVNAIVGSGESERVGLVSAKERLPFATSSADGVLFTSQRGARLEEALRILKPGGRLVVRAGVTVIPHFRELARDDRNVVGESVGPLIALSR